MSKCQAATNAFDSDLKSILPRLRVYAMSLTHDRDRADELVQQTAVKALVGRKSFRPGTNFGGWLFRIQRNEFISGLRRLRPTVCFDEISTNALSHPPHQESGLIMHEFMGAFRQLSSGTRQALLLAVVEGYSYKQIAEPAGISVGTVKSRISRGRSALQEMLAEKSPAMANGTRMAPPVSQRLPSRGPPRSRPAHLAAPRSLFLLGLLGPRDFGEWRLFPPRPEGRRHGGDGVGGRRRLNARAQPQECLQRTFDQSALQPVDDEDQPRTPVRIGPRGHVDGRMDEVLHAMHRDRRQ